MSFLEKLNYALKEIMFQYFPVLFKESSPNDEKSAALTSIMSGVLIKARISSSDNLARKGGSIKTLLESPVVRKRVE